MTSVPVILAVEDEALLRMDIVGQFEARGYDVFEAADASEAMSLLRRNPAIDVLFTDVDMPGEMNGLMLAVATRRHWPLISIIITSGHRQINAEDLPQGSRFFSKPYRGEAIMAAIEEMTA